MKRQIRAALLLLAAASALTVCASTSLASPPASRDFPGYWRVVNGGQELFCDKERESHFLLVVCFTRSQLLERQRAVQGFDSGPLLLPQSAQFVAAGRPGSAN